MKNSYWHNFYPENVYGENICLDCFHWLKLAFKDLPRIYNLVGQDRHDAPSDQKINKKLDDLRRNMKKDKKNYNEKSQEKNPEKSERMMIIQQMADRGNVRAINEIAQHQYFGNYDHGVPVNRAQAFENYARAARLGDINAEANVGILKFQSKILTLKILAANTTEEKEEAFKMLNQSAHKDIKASMNALGWAYENG